MLVPRICIAALLAGAALAENLPAQQPPAGGEFERLTVIGTRLHTSSADGAYPITVIGREQISSSGQVSLGDFLQELPFVIGALSRSGRRIDLPLARHHFLAAL